LSIVSARQAHTAFGKGTDYEPYRTGNGNFRDFAWWDEPCAPIPRLPFLVRLLIEVLLPVARSVPKRAKGLALTFANRLFPAMGITNLLAKFG